MNVNLDGLSKSGWILISRSACQFGLPLDPGEQTRGAASLPDTRSGVGGALCAVGVSHTQRRAGALFSSALATPGTEEAEGTL